MATLCRVISQLSSHVTRWLRAANDGGQPKGSPMRPHRLAIIFLAAFAGAAPLPALAAPVWTGILGTEAAVGGYDSVSYFNGTPVMGSDAFTTRYKGATFKFANAQNLAAFKAAGFDELDEVGDVGVLVIVDKLITHDFVFIYFIFLYMRTININSNRWNIYFRFFLYELAKAHFERIYSLSISVTNNSIKFF
jgi:hypothetical protein